MMLYKGIFWIKDLEEPKENNICWKIPVDVMVLWQQCFQNSNLIPNYKSIVINAMGCFWDILRGKIINVIR